MDIRTAPYTLSVKLSDFNVWRHTWWKNWVNCAVLTDNSAGLRTVLSSHLSHTELRSSLRESHSYRNLPANTTMSSSQGTSISSNSFSRWASHDIFLFKYHFLLRVLPFLFYFSDNIMADVASKQQNTALCLSTIVTRTRRHTKLTNIDKPNGKPVLCQRTFSSIFSAVVLHSWTAQMFYTVELHSCFTQLNCTVFLHSWTAQLFYTVELHSCVTQLNCTVFNLECMELLKFRPRQLPCFWYSYTRVIGNISFISTITFCCMDASTCMEIQVWCVKCSPRQFRLQTVCRLDEDVGTFITLSQDQLWGPLELLSNEQ
jgi:hypothetical protein